MQFSDDPQLKSLHERFTADSEYLRAQGLQFHSWGIDRTGRYVVVVIDLLPSQKQLLADRYGDALDVVDAGTSRNLPA